MATIWLITSYKNKSNDSREYKYCPLEDFAQEIRSADGAWSTARIDEDNIIVKVRCPSNIINIIVKNSDVQIIKTDTPEEHWKPTWISKLSGRVRTVRTLVSLDTYILDDQKWGELKAEADGYVTLADREGYKKIPIGDWKITAQLLKYLGKNGYGLNKVSTGTFPTTGILDNFDRADANTLGANWTTSKVWSGATNWGIVSSQAYNDVLNAYADQYYNVSTYGPDSEVYITINPIQTNDDIALAYLRLTSPGASFDAYAMNFNHNNTPESWYISEYTDGVGANIAGPELVNITSGDKLGGEAIGSTLSSYIYTGGSWTLVDTVDDATLGTAGYLGLYASGNPIDWRMDDFGGGTVVAAGGGNYIPVQVIG